MPRSEATPQGCCDDHVASRGWYTLWVVIALIILAHIDRQVLILLGAPMAATLGLSDNQLGMIQGIAFAIFTVVAVYPIAWAADRFDQRIVAGACLFIWSAGTAGCALATSFTELFLGAVAIAAGESGLAPIVLSFVPDLFHGRKRVTANSLLYFFSFLGVVAGLGVGGGVVALIDRLHADLPGVLRGFESWRLTLVLAAAPAPILLVLLAFTQLRRGKVQPPVVSGAQRLKGFGSYLRQHKGAIGSVLGGVGVHLFGFAGLLIWLPVVTARLFATSAAQNGPFMAIAIAAGLIGGVTAGPAIVRRMMVRRGAAAPIRFYWLAVIGGIPSMGLLPLVTAPWQVFVLLAMLMAAYTAAGCALPTILQDLAPSQYRARLSAIWGVIAGLVSGLAPALVGLASSYAPAGPRALPIILALVAAASWPVAILLLRRGERPYAELTATLAAAGPK